MTAFFCLQRSVSLYTDLSEPFPFNWSLKVVNLTNERDLIILDFASFRWEFRCEDKNLVILPLRDFLVTQDPTVGFFCTYISQVVIHTLAEQNIGLIEMEKNVESEKIHIYVVLGIKKTLKGCGELIS